MKKKSQAEVLAIVLIILLVLAAFIIIYNFVKKTTKEKAGEVGIDQLTMSLTTDKATLYQNMALVPVTRESGNGELIMIRIIFVSSSDGTFIYENSTDLPKELETKIYRVILPNNFNPTSFKVYPIIRIPQGKGIVGMEAFGTGVFINSDCTANCTGKSCGDDGCGGICGTCPDGKDCSIKGECKVGWCKGADMNHDRMVDGGDLAIWQQNYNPTGIPPCSSTNSSISPFKPWCNWADATRDSKVDGADLAIYQQNYDPLGLANCSADDYNR